MVRVKTRWILARIDFDRHMGRATTTTTNNNKDNEQYRRHITNIPELEINHHNNHHPNKPGSLSLFFPSRKEVFFLLHENHILNFGLSVSAEAEQIHVRFCDPTTRLILIRVPRDSYPRIRSTITFITNILGRSAIISIIKVNGSVRTAKLCTIQIVRNIYRNHFQQQRLLQDKNKNNKNPSKLQVGMTSSSPPAAPPPPRELAITPQIRTECALLEQTLSELHGLEF